MALVVFGLKAQFPLKTLLKFSQLARSTYYAIIRSLNKADKYSEMKIKIRYICESHFGRYGYRRVTAEMHKQGININHKVVMRLMKQEGLTSKVRLKKYRSYKGQHGKIAPNIVQRNFCAVKPNQKWTTDITEFSLFGTKLYLSPILDMFNGEIISYELSKAPSLQQVINMMEKAFTKVKTTKGIIFHSDQGWQYQHSYYQQTLKNHGIIQSMSRKGNCLDNSVMENFFGLLKSELLHLQNFQSIEDFEKKLHEYIYYYNNKRIKLKLKGMSPVEYRTHSELVA
ncbi:IS3 family transposase [Phascolarctobacterium faecium]|uniref:IS3 family transposase n=1 Tax=Phascolarctobacterium faecium TaxID=33025 RepID=UPI003AB4305F